MTDARSLSMARARRRSTPSKSTTSVGPMATHVDVAKSRRHDGRPAEDVARLDGQDRPVLAPGQGHAQRDPAVDDDPHLLAGRTLTDQDRAIGHGRSGVRRQRDAPGSGPTGRRRTRWHQADPSGRRSPWRHRRPERLPPRGPKVPRRCDRRTWFCLSGRTLGRGRGRAGRVRAEPPSGGGRPTLPPPVRPAVSWSHEDASDPPHRPCRPRRPRAVLRRALRRGPPHAVPARRARG